jgi:ribonuclease E
MARKMLIDATHAEETRVVVVDGTRVEEFDFETVNKRQLAGNIYLAKVTRVEASLQAAFVDYGGNRHGFLAFSEIHPDYYQIPVEDRAALVAEENRLTREEADEADADTPKARRGRRRRKPAQAEAAGTAAAGTQAADPVEPQAADDSPAGMAVIALDDDAQADGGPDEDDDAPRPAEAEAEAIETVAAEDVEEEVRGPRRPRARRYKISEVIKVRQIMLVQVVKEERGNKGAALTTYLSLAGRYCVLMPNTARGGGISRKITNAADRKKLKEIASEIDVPEGAGLIIRTAGSERTRAEIKRDYEYLLRLWEQIRDLTLKSIAPAPIYEEGNLIKRAIRDLYARDIDEVLVEGDAGYRLAKDFMKMLMPSHARNVKPYAEPLPLFARYQVESYLSSMFNPVVQLKSGGYIVIGVTEALVAIDVNSGRATKEGSIEETALKTNLEAAEEIARQLRLRDLAGLIVIDFIDMDERKNNAAVEKRLKDKLKTDRARIQLGRISGFGLLEMSRQRLRPGMLEASTAPCPHCHGTGLIRSDDSVALSILRQLEEEGVRGRAREMLVRAPVSVTNFLINQKRAHIARIELRYGVSIRIEADPGMVSPDHSIERFRTATRPVPEAAPVVLADARPAAAEDEDDAAEAETLEDDAAAERENDDEAGDEAKKKKRRRRRGGRGRKKPGEPGVEARNGEAPDSLAGADADGGDESAGEAAGAAMPAPEAEADAAPGAAKKPRRTRKPRKTAEVDAPVAPAQPEAADGAAGMENAATDAPPAAAPEPEPEAEAAAEQAPEPAAAAASDPAPEPAAAAEADPEPAAASEPEPPAAADAAAAPPDDPARPRRRGWWNIGG